MNRGFGEEAQSNFTASTLDGAETQVLRFSAKIGPGGRVVIPAEVRRALGVDEGDVLSGELKDGEINFVSFDSMIAEIQAEMQTLKRPGVDEIESFLADRRAMWGETD